MFIEPRSMQDQAAPLGAQCKASIIRLLKQLNYSLFEGFYKHRAPGGATPAKASV